MSRWRAERMGTASHYENGKTIERLQRAFDGIERPAPKRPQTRAERRRLQRERDIEDAYMPDTSMQDVTAERDKDAGRTFSHRHGKEMSLREQREAAARLIDCPDVINRAGLYDTITLRDSEGEEYEHILDFPETKTPPIFNAFRGEYIGAIHSVGGYAYQLVKVQKADGGVYTLAMMEQHGKKAEGRSALEGRQRAKHKKEQTSRDDSRRSGFVKHWMDEQIPRRNRDHKSPPSVPKWRKGMPATRGPFIAPTRDDYSFRHYAFPNRSAVSFRSDWHIIAKPRNGRRREWKVTPDFFDKLESMMKFGKFSDIGEFLQYMMGLRLKEVKQRRCR